MKYAENVCAASSFAISFCHARAPRFSSLAIRFASPMLYVENENVCARIHALVPLGIIYVDCKQGKENASG